MRLIVIGIVIILIIIGAVSKKVSINELSQRLLFTVNYKNDFTNFCEYIHKNGQFETNLYNKLMQDENKIQRELGIDGIVSVYSDPLAGIQMKNYPLFLNVFGELRNYMTEYALFSERINLLIGSCDEALIKHIGNLKEAIQIGEKRIRNPFYCFANGVNCIISLPVKILEWCGIINDQSSNRILNSKILRALESICTIIGLLASLITIIVGWGPFTDWLKMLIR